MLFSPIETIAELDAAWRDRRDDGESLFASNRHYWSVYTFGYVLELLLKAAYFRRCGLMRDDSISWYLDKARDWAGALGISAPRNLHDLVFWAELLLAERAFAKDALPVSIANSLMAQIQLVAGYWRVEMRYHPAVGAALEADEVRRSVRGVIALEPQL